MSTAHASPTVIKPSRRRTTTVCGQSSGQPLRPLAAVHGFGLNPGEHTAKQRPTTGLGQNRGTPVRARTAPTTELTRTRTTMAPSDGATPHTPHVADRTEAAAGAMRRRAVGRTEHVITASEET
jgi:hypothetical protein